MRGDVAHQRHPLNMILVLYIHFHGGHCGFVYTFSAAVSTVHVDPQVGWYVFPLDVTTLVLMMQQKKELCRIVQELVTVHARILLTLKVDAILKAWYQPGADGLSLVVPTVHGTCF